VSTTHNLSLAEELGRRTLVLSEEHELIFDGEIQDLLRDEERLMAANLVHAHRHRHGRSQHRHFHAHDWS
jgi:cobalt/nickel transport system ATP-binding protein